MHKPWIEVVVTERDPNGRGKCEYCDMRVWLRTPTNYPQVCHECADKYVWHYCDKAQRT